MIEIGPNLMELIKVISLGLVVVLGIWVLARSI
jgi:hypothetical protein